MAEMDGAPGGEHPGRFPFFPPVFIGPVQEIFQSVLFLDRDMKFGSSG